MNMDWNNNMTSSGRPGFVTRSGPENSFNFLFNYNLDPFQGMEMKQSGSCHGGGSTADMMVAPPHMMNPATLMDKLGGGSNGYGGDAVGGCMTTMSMSPHAAQLAADKKKRLSNDQLDSLENSFQEDIKLDPDRKMKLARDLGLQPRQVAVWFQNRRARWKAKQLEQLYDSLKLEFDAISNEKQKLQEEVMTLRAMLMEQAAARNNNVHNNNKQQVSTAAGYTDFSGEETVESTSGLHTISGGGSGCSTRLTSPAPQQGMMSAQHGHVVVDPYCHYLLTAADVECNPGAVSPSPPPPQLSSPYWAVVTSTLPAAYPC